MGFGQVLGYASSAFIHGTQVVHALGVVLFRPLDVKLIGQGHILWGAEAFFMQVAEQEMHAGYRMRLVLFQIGQNIQRHFRVRLQILSLDEQARLLHQSFRIPGFRGFQYIILVQFPVRLHADALLVIAGQPLETAYVLLFHQGGGCRHGRGQKLLPFRRLLHIPCHGFIIIGQLVQCRQAAEFHSLFPELHGFRIDGFRGRGLAFPAGRGHPGRNGSGIRRNIFPLTLLFRFPEPRRSVGVLSVQG